MDAMARPITLHQPKRLEIGAGASSKLGEWAAGTKRVLVIATEHTVGFVDRLKLSGDIEVFSNTPPEPDDKALDAALATARALKPELVVGLGGGSVLDVAKLVAALWDGNQSLDHVVGPNKVAGRRTALAQVATTAGTGSEAGIRALITDSATHSKKAVESPHLLADIAILDPELTWSVPPAVTAATGIDAMAHCVEAFTNINAHDLIDGYARMGIRLVGKYLARAVENGKDTEARAGMMLASYYGGICLGPVNTAAGHALAYPLGTRLGLPHGLANAIIFPHVLAFNVPARAEKTAEVLEALGLAVAKDPEGVLDAAYGFCKALGVEMRLSAHKAQEADLSDWATEAHAIRRLMNNNPRDMSVEDVLGVYRAAY
ncbi:iron-containing alcohol dehydrogenase [Agrobacterium larrymoorei]|uniref:Iron-containing alcohol dehydrogenase n=1 Tax=Agrobacterium larrymoorei TaxID=160699 RepID=A0A4D7E514_9HYPH|nr:iron-containing alcohol dehydrogenase [Agrobacterium larrymoorei]QCJ00201.1 iron-containing alcohol dehydrogenase [Agrobacterium larrymoorei]QYA09358.1 iron-containing alcohol dehydrogenase [Agrobacterium larrymoorei]